MQVCKQFAPTAHPCRYDSGKESTSKNFMLHQHTLNVLAIRGVSNQLFTEFIGKGVELGVAIDKHFILAKWDAQPKNHI